MEATFQPSVSSVRSKIALIEFIELSILTFAVWLLGISNALKEPGTTLASQFNFLIGLALIVLGSWVIYLAYIRITRGLYPRLDIRLRILIVVLTGSYTLWAWLLLDLNRFIVSKLFYRGEAPVEYAWSSRSKQVRKTWEELRKIGAA
jgi:hypothetical protein